MAYGESFYGDHLRLTSFLRVVHRLPQRPSRFRKKAQQVCYTENEDEDLLEKGYSFPVQKINQIDRIHTIANGLEPKNPQSPELSGTPNAPKSSPNLAHKVSKNSPFGELAPCTDLEVPTSDEKDESSSPPVSNNDGWNSTVQPGRKLVVVYKSNARNANSPNDVTSQSQKTRLPISINELILVRTTTVDGLPNQDTDHISPPPSISSIDPIEDSQNLCGQLQLHSKPASSPVRRPQCVGFRQRSISVSSIQKWKRLPQSKRSSLKPGPFSPDGFVGAELRLQPNAKVAPRKEIVHKKQLPYPRARLEFFQGPLPVTPTTEQTAC